MPLVARVVVENAAQSFDKIYSYRVPEGMPVRPGCRVTAPFGAGNRTRFGLAVAVEEEPDAAGLKPLATLVDPEPLLSDKLLSLVFWLRDNTFCTYFDAVKALLPPGIGWSWNIPTSFPRTRPPPKTRRNAGFTTTSRGGGSRCGRRRSSPRSDSSGTRPVLRELCARGTLQKAQEVRRRVLDGKLVMVRLDGEIGELSDVRVKLTSKQKAVVELLLQVGEASLKEVCYFAAVGKSVVDRWFRRGRRGFSRGRSTAAPTRRARRGRTRRRSC